MLWLIAIPVIIAIAALVWWSSGRAKPLGSPRDPFANPVIAKAVGDTQVHRGVQLPPGFPGSPRL